MQIIIKIFLISGLVLGVVNAQNQINAIKVPGNISEIGPQSKAWLSAEYSDVTLYSYTTIKMTNPKSTLSGENTKAKKTRIKALYDGTNLSLLLEWEDGSKNIQEECCSSSHADGFALQFPTQYEDVSKLPYISMGNKDRAVVLYLKEAVSESEKVYFQSIHEYFDTYQKQVPESIKTDNGRIFISKGYEQVEELTDDSSSVMMNMIYKEGVWKATLTRPLKDKLSVLKDGAFPLSIVLWDGDDSNSEKIEYISSWIGVKLLGESGGDELVDVLNTQIDGDFENGKKLALENCAACHNFAQNAMAPENMAPNLSNIGGYSTVQYLRESLLYPSAVITPGYNPKVQLDFPWYNQDAIGNYTSTMPSYNWMDEKSINDLIVYFKVLKAEIE